MRAPPWAVADVSTASGSIRFSKGKVDLRTDAASFVDPWGFHLPMLLRAATFALKPRAAVRCVIADMLEYGMCAKRLRGARPTASSVAIGRM